MDIYLEIVSRIISAVIGSSLALGIFILLESRSQRREYQRSRMAREDALKAMREARAQKLREDEAHRFQSDIATFPSHGNFWGQPFSSWQEQLQDLVDRGLSLDSPNEHFDSLKKAVIDGVAFNQNRVALASHVSDPNTQGSLAMASYHVSDAQACLKHLQSIEAKWAQDRYDAMDQTTAPAMGVSKRAGRL